MSSSSSRSPSPSGSATPAHSTQTKDQEESKVSLAEEVSTETPSRDDEPKPPQHAWQAIFSPQHNAYYFFNAETQETTWVNPLEPTASGSTANTTSSSDPTPTPDASTAEQQEEAQSSSSAPSSSINPATSHYAALQAAAAAQGIDPALAHLDPSLLSSIPGQAVDKSGLPVFSAKFNRHTGAFARPDARDPSHLSEHERAKRMSEFYFDVGKWEQDLAKHGGSIKASSGDMYGGASGSSGQGSAADGEWEDDGHGGRKRKRPNKKEMEMYKDKKKQKKLAKTAWLRN